ITDGPYANKPLVAYHCTTLTVLNNTFYQRSIESSDAAASISVGDHYVRNNIFMSKYGSPIDVDDIEDLDHNNLYSQYTPIVGIYDETKYYSIQDWRAATGQSLHSTSVNPYFDNDANLIASNSALDETGDTVPVALAWDKNGAARDIYTPDIGALEFTPTASLDAGIDRLDYTLTKPVLAEIFDIDVYFRNNGKDSVQNVNISWSIDDVYEGTIPYVANLASGEEAYLSLKNIILNQMDKKKLTVWIASTNDANETLTKNDTLTHYLYGALVEGTHTVGGASPDIQDLVDVSNHLNMGGYYGKDVVLNLRDGEYDGGFMIYDVPGFDEDTTSLTIQSESGDSTAVVIKHTEPEPGRESTMYIESVPNFNLKGVTVMASGDEKYGIALQMSGNNPKANIESCRFICDYTPSFFGYSVVHLAESVSEDYMTFKYNHFSGGYKSLYYAGTTSPYTKGLTFVDNKLEGSIYGAEFWYLDSCTIKGNSFYGKRYGLRVSNVQNEIMIDGNKIMAIDYDGDYPVYGLYISNTSGSTNVEPIFSNNLVSASGNDEAYGIYVQSGNYANIINNTVKVQGSSSYGSAFRLTSGSNHNVVNNIFANFAGGYAITTNNLYNLVDTSDYNAYYTTGYFFAYDDGDKYSSLPNWLFHNGQTDSNSMVINPYFVNEQSFEVAQSQLNETGILFAGVDKDFNGIMRDATTDIGAYEFDVNSYDLVLESVYTPDTFKCSGSVNLKAVISNLGAANVTSAQLGWQVNGMAQTGVTYTGDIATNESDTIDLGTYSYNPQGSQEKYEIVAWTYNPNGNLDENLENDTSVTIAYSGLEGNYSVGTNVGADFNNLEELNDFLAMNSVICGPTIFEFESGTYEGYLEIPALSGASSTNTLVFKSKTNNAKDVTLWIDDEIENYAMIYLNGADYVKLEYLTLTQKDDDYYIVQFENGATYNTIANCIFIHEDKY
ncbi:MAG: hypothetical protein MI922_10505, partial [Bacteroidales bacterium]|nr:hypothetical protein [Bacteroidales bacterium]